VIIQLRSAGCALRASAYLELDQSPEKSDIRTVPNQHIITAVKRTYDALQRQLVKFNWWSLGPTILPKPLVGIGTVRIGSFPIADAIARLLRLET